MFPARSRTCVTCSGVWDAHCQIRDLSEVFGVPSVSKIFLARHKTFAVGAVMSPDGSGVSSS